MIKRTSPPQPENLWTTFKRVEQNSDSPVVGLLQVRNGFDAYTIIVQVKDFSRQLQGVSLVFAHAMA